MISTRQLLLLISFLPAAIANALLWRLPAAAASNGAGTGAGWPMATVAVSLAVLALITSLTIAWVVIRQRPRVVAILPVFAAVVAIAGRRLAVSGAPEEFYLLDDAKIWIVLLALAIVLSSLLVAAPIGRNRVAI